MKIPTTAVYPRFRGNSVVEFESRNVPAPGPGQLLIQCKANALCASEVGMFQNGAGITPGHEAAGIVASAGVNTTIPVGRHGVIFLMDFCGTCRSCRRGATNQCLAKRADYGFSHDGGYADTHQVEVNGLNGRVQIDDTVRRYSFQAKGSEMAEVWQAGYFNDEDREFHQTFDKHFDATLAAFKEGKEPPVHARAGRRALELAHAAIRSFQEGRTISAATGSSDAH